MYNTNSTYSVATSCSFVTVTCAIHWLEGLPEDPGEFLVFLVTAESMLHFVTA
jgi:hypothetical protein